MDTQVDMGVLEALLGQIDRIYDLRLGVSIGGFMIGRETCHRLAGEPMSAGVLVKQGEGLDGIEVGVYIGEGTLHRLKEIDLAGDLTREELALLCAAIEEVSHFAYLLWNARRGKPVTQLELELQGEVDKFVTALLLLAQQNRGRVPADLLDRISSGGELREGLDESRRDRYAAAGAFARAYCRFLIRRYLRKQRVQDLLVELRRFYRLSQGGKIGHIQRAVYAA